MSRVQMRPPPEGPTSGETVTADQLAQGTSMGGPGLRRPMQPQAPVQVAAPVVPQGPPQPPNAAPSPPRAVAPPMQPTQHPQMMQPAPQPPMQAAPPQYVPQAPTAPQQFVQPVIDTRAFTVPAPVVPAVQVAAAVAPPAPSPEPIRWQAPKVAMLLGNFEGRDAHLIDQLAAFAQAEDTSLHELHKLLRAVFAG